MVELFKTGTIVTLGLAFVLSIRAQTIPQYDGPAELPRTAMATSMTSTPASNIPKVVGPADNLQTVLNSAQCSDIIQVDPANILTASAVILPIRTDCDAQHWVIITSSGVLPPEGVRIKPGTPMPRIVLTVSNSKISGCTFVRLIGFEITRTQGSGTITNLIAPGTGAHDCIFDRVYVHGTPNDETARGFQLSNSTNITIIDSYISEFHCRAVSGACGDAQAIAGGTSSSQEGPFLIRNNYLSASGENILFGGGPALGPPTDITIVDNDFVKPDSWNPNDPSYAPTSGKDGIPHPWIVKNLFELKNGKRVLLENNRMIGSWGGFSQTGFAILLTPKNQAGPSNTNQCPACLVEDVTVRGNHISKSSAALQLACIRSDNGGAPAGCGNWSIRYNTFDDLQYPTCYGCDKWMVQISSDLTPPTGIVLHDVLIDHNSFINDGWLLPGGFMTLGGPAAGIVGPDGKPVPQMRNIQYTNNVQYSGKYPVWSTGGGPANCAYGHMDRLVDMFPACWIGNSAFTGNIIMTQPGNAVSVWPPANYAIPAGNIPQIGGTPTTIPVAPVWKPLAAKRKVGIRKTGKTRPTINKKIGLSHHYAIP